jgi:hypothetical protein
MKFNAPIHLNCRWRSKLLKGIHKCHGYFNLCVLTYMTFIAIINPQYVSKEAYIIMLMSIAIYMKLIK